jgi:ATP-dependent RNA helicase SUPV3L1/SUV3
VAREQMLEPLASLDRQQRRIVTGFGIRIGALDLFMPDALKPGAMRLRSALRAAAAGQVMTALPDPSTVVLPLPEEPARARLARLGFRVAGPQMIRVDMAERLARHAHKVRSGEPGPLIDLDLVTSIGLRPEAVAKLMRDIGFRQAANEAGWIWRGHGRRRTRDDEQGSPAFAALSGLKRG